MGIEEGPPVLFARDADNGVPGSGRLGMQAGVVDPEIAHFLDPDMRAVDFADQPKMTADELALVGERRLNGRSAVGDVAGLAE